MTVTPGRHCPCERHLSISAPGSGARGGEAAGLRGDVIAESQPGRGREDVEGLEPGGWERVGEEKKENKPWWLSPGLGIHRAINNPTPALLLTWNGPSRLLMREGELGLQPRSHTIRNPWGSPVLPKALRCLTLAGLPGAGFWLRDTQG